MQADVARKAGLPENAPIVDQTVARGFTKETAVYKVPLDTSEELVQFRADKYKRVFGHNLEAQGFQIHSISKPILDTRPHVKCNPDEKQYAMLAICSRRPVTTRFEVPDAAVPELLKLGASLV